MKTPAAPAAPAAPTPAGTPPGGGRWAWDGAQWQPLPEDGQPSATPAAPAAPTDNAPQE